MTVDEFYRLVKKAIDEGGWGVPAGEVPEEYRPLADLVDDILRRNRLLDEEHRTAVDYIRAKINQMLEMIGTAPIREEELDEKNLIALDPLGIISQSFAQILEHSNQTNRSLTLARDEIQAIFEAVGGGLLVVDENRRIISFNRQFREMFCPGEEEVVGKHCYDIVCGDKNYPAESCVFKGVIGTGELSFQPDWESHGRHLRVAASPIRDSSGRLIRSVLLYVDITQQKKTEEELAKATRLESLGIFAGDIAHDFNNLLTGVIGNVSLAKALVENDEKLSKLLDETEKSSYRAKGLTQQLLTFARGGDPIKTRVSIDDLLRESVEFCLRGSSVRYELNLPAGIWQVEVDEGQIGQVIQNLVLNGAQAMSMSGAMEIVAENVEIDQEEEPLLIPGKYVKVSIIDHGEGIPAKDVEKVFDPFYTTKPEGSGLGLSTCYSIIGKHSGTIAVDSTYGKGSTFTFYLPATGAAEAREDRQSETVTRGQGRVLVMDDEELVRETTKAMLEFSGYSTEMAVDGEEALARYGKAMADGEPFDVVIMDLTIPGGMGGRETIARLLDLDPKVRAIVSSGYANDPIMADYRSYGFRRVIPKPYKIQELSNLIAEVIGEAD